MDKAMCVAGIVCEYNPFHNGHLHQIEETRRLGATHIVAVMSGNFVQRGDIAIAEKHIRARAALQNGADLVLELPCTYALSSAEYFAKGAVYLLNALGCVDLLSFGSECGDISLLRKAADAAKECAASPMVLEAVSAGHSYPTAMQHAITAGYDESLAKVFAAPNNILAVEYMKALDFLDSKLEPVTIPRLTAAHDSNLASGAHASASLLRTMLKQGKDISAFIPIDVLRSDELACMARLEAVILYKLRTMTAEEIAQVPDVAQGLENRIYAAARKACSLSELLLLIKTKRYTLSRIRRIVCCCLLGITKKDLQIIPPYARMIGMNKNGLAVLKCASAAGAIPVAGSLAKLRLLSEEANRFAQLEALSTDIFALALNKMRPCGLDYTEKAVIL